MLRMSCEITHLDFHEQGDYWQLPGFASILFFGELDKLGLESAKNGLTSTSARIPCVTIGTVPFTKSNELCMAST